MKIKVKDSSIKPIGVIAQIRCSDSRTLNAAWHSVTNFLANSDTDRIRKSYLTLSNSCFWFIPWIHFISKGTLCYRMGVLKSSVLGLLKEDNENKIKLPG